MDFTWVAIALGDVSWIALAFLLRPVLKVRGQTREGTDAPSLLFEEFVTALRRDLPSGTLIVDRLASTSTNFTLELSSLLPPEPAADESDQDEEGEG